MFKAVFITKHKYVKQQGRIIDFMGKINGWLDENIENLYDNFLKSKPTYEQLLFIHKWFNPTRFKLQTKIDKELVYKMTINKFRIALTNIVEEQVKGHK